MKFLGMKFQTIYGSDGKHRSKYMSRAIIGRLRVHLFHRGDEDPDPHDHPWSFWTFPLGGYYERVYEGDRTFVRYVKPWRLHFRPASYTHRVLTPPDGHSWMTIVWTSGKERPWGFYVRGRFVPWREYVFGKETPEQYVARMQRLGGL